MKNVGKVFKSNLKCLNAYIRETGEILCGGEGRTLRTRLFSGGEECYVPNLFELVLLGSKDLGFMYLES